MQRPDQPPEALSSADPYLLMTALAHLTGETDLVERAWPASQKHERSAADLPAELRQEAIARMRDYLHSRPVPVPASPELMARLVQFCAGQEVPGEYVPMLLEESGVIARPLDCMPAVTREAPDVAIIGAGLSGIATAIHLKKLAIPFTIYEANEDVGGTWFDNRYPGCGVDTPSHSYAYSFAINPAWPRYFSKQPEMLAYIEQCVNEHGLREHIRFGHRLQEARWDEAAMRWHCMLTLEKGGSLDIAPRVLVSAVGQLNIPSLPSIAGIDTFGGKVVHTARWSDEIEHRGKRVALIGTGASAVQIGPTMAPDVERLLVFQRSPQWLSHRPTYHRPVGRDELWLLANVPFFVNWHRLRIMWQFADALYPALLTDEGGEVSHANRKLRKQWSDYIERKMASRPDLIDRVLPDYPPLAKRVPVDFGWYDMLLRENVELVDTPIDHLEADRIITADGQGHAVDLIVLATGFKATRMLQGMEITGRGGCNLRAFWDEDDPRAYLGMTVPGFPNFFIMYGPNTNLGHGGSLIFQGECQARYIAQAVRHMAETHTEALEVRASVFEAYNGELDQQLSRMVWTTAGVSNWFRNSKGRIVTNSPWRVVDYWKRTRNFVADAYLADSQAD